MTDWDGQGYEQISALQRHLAQRTLAGLEFRGDERVLDVGCGDGFITRSIAARLVACGEAARRHPVLKGGSAGFGRPALPAGSVVGVDASPRMVEVARSRPDPAGADIRFEVGDVLALPFVDEFDVVVSFIVLHWLVDQQAALTRIAGATKSGGRVIVQQVCAGPRPSLEQLAMQVCARPRWTAAFADFAAPYVHVEPAYYPAIAAAAGLRVTERQVQDLEWDFGSREAFTQWCTVGFADWTARLPSAEVAAWVDDVVTDYQQLVGRPGLFRFMQLRAQLTPA
jgi:trans-aconitate 2-methyltransferase